MKRLIIVIVALVAIGAVTGNMGGRTVGVTPLPTSRPVVVSGIDTGGVYADYIGTPPTMSASEQIRIHKEAQAEADALTVATEVAR